MKIKFIIAFIITFIVLIMVFGTLTINNCDYGYYYKTDKKIGDKQIYNYKCVSFNLGSCKGLEIVTIYSEQDYDYHVNYYCDGRGYYIKHNKKYLRLDKALELNLITLEEIKNSNIVMKKEVEQFTFQAEIIEKRSNDIVVEPKQGTRESMSNENIIISLIKTKLIDKNGNTTDFSSLEVGIAIEITYNGLIVATSPGQINDCYKIKILD